MNCSLLQSHVWGGTSKPGRHVRLIEKRIRITFTVAGIGQNSWVISVITQKLFAFTLITFFEMHSSLVAFQSVCFELFLACLQTGGSVLVATASPFDLSAAF